MPEITVTANGTEKLLSKLDPSKATGPDEISSRILKQYAIFTFRCKYRMILFV
jgi:hypothetical protein